MTTLEKLDLLNKRKNDLESDICDLEDQIKDLEREEWSKPENVEKRQMEWDALPEMEKQRRRNMADLYTVIALKDMSPGPFVTMGISNWIVKSDEA